MGLRPAVKKNWPVVAPFRTDVFVLTPEKRKPWVRPGGTTFYFENDGPLAALKKARPSAGAKDIRICGGADVIQQYLNAGLVDELEIAQTSVIFGSGRRLFDQIQPDMAGFRIDSVTPSPWLRICGMRGHKEL